MSKQFNLHIPLFFLLTLRLSYAASIVETYPSLQKHLYSEKQSNTYIGFGLSPISIINSKIGFSANVFQIHWIKGLYDFELLSASYGLTIGQSQFANDQYFLFRSVPKIRIFRGMSIGPLIGLEYVTFPNLSQNLNKNAYFTPAQPFSSVGAVYGAVLSETFPIDSTYSIKINQIIYKETYSYTGTNNGWKYYFQENSLNTDPSAIKPTTVFVLEASVIF